MDFKMPRYNQFILARLLLTVFNSEEKDLTELSSLGHFLKGSSATLGLTNVKDGCEKIQHFGAGKDETGSVNEPDESVSLKKIDATLKEVKTEYAKVEKFLRRYYGEKE